MYVTPEALQFYRAWNCLSVQSEGHYNNPFLNQAIVLIMLWKAEHQMLFLCKLELCSVIKNKSSKFATVKIAVILADSLTKDVRVNFFQLWKNCHRIYLLIFSGIHLTDIEILSSLRYNKKVKKGIPSN